MRRELRFDSQRGFRLFPRVYASFSTPTHRIACREKELSKRKGGAGGMWRGGPYTDWKEIGMCERESELPMRPAAADRFGAWRRKTTRPW